MGQPQPPQPQKVQTQIKKNTQERIETPDQSIPETKPFNLIPNGSKKPVSDIAQHLTSLLNSFFSTTQSPVAPSLPSLVEDTEFADIVKGYKGSRPKIEKAPERPKATTSTSTSQPILPVQQNQPFDE